MNSNVASANNMMGLGTPVGQADNTININQASCMIERATLEGREFINVCTGQVMQVPYSLGEYVTGAIFLLIAGFVLINFIRIGSRMRR